MGSSEVNPGENKHCIQVARPAALLLRAPLLRRRRRSLGRYGRAGQLPATTVQLGANTTITPDAAPTNTTSINVSASTNFKGQLEGNPTTGVLRLTNAHPAGDLPGDRNRL